MDEDIEKRDSVKINYLNGYPSLANFIASDKDHSTAIFRRFDRLSFRNLLQLQSELCELEARQDALDAEDFHASTEQKGVLSNWALFRARASEPGNEREKLRMELAREVREKLKEYGEALLLESTLLSLKPPSSRALHAFRNVFNNRANDPSGDGFPTLGGRSAGIYEAKEDLMSLGTVSEEDRLTALIRHACPWLFVKQRTNSDLIYISERRLQIAVIVISIILAFALLFGAIYHLYSVSNDQTKLRLIAFYTIAFAICVGLVTNARRSEIFGACATYAAVLVVFISGNLSKDNSS